MIGVAIPSTRTRVSASCVGRTPLTKVPVVVAAGPKPVPKMLIISPGAMAPGILLAALTMPLAATIGFAVEIGRVNAGNWVPSALKITICSDCAVDLIAPGIVTLTVVEFTNAEGTVVPFT